MRLRSGASSSASSGSRPRSFGGRSRPDGAAGMMSSIRRVHHGMTSDSLERFVRAQEPVIERVRAELRAGRKASHWMWFVFPQIQGLGHSPMARRFALASRAEAEAYLRHPVLGSRLRECTRLVNEVE